MILKAPYFLLILRVNIKEAFTSMVRLTTGEKWMFYNAAEKASALETGGKLSKGLQFTSVDLKKLHDLFLTIEPVEDEHGKKSLKSTLASPKTIAALAARGVTLDELRGMLILYKGHSYSNWCVGSQKDYSAYSSLVPLPWAAAKAAYGVPYSAWKAETFGTGYFISNARDEFISSDEYEERYRRLEEQVLNDSTLMNWARQQSVTGGRDYSPHRINDTEYNSEFAEDFNKGFGGLTANRWCRTLLLQIWLAGGHLRSDKMILCPYDYDCVPEYIPTNRDQKKNSAATDFKSYMKEELGF